MIFWGLHVVHEILPLVFIFICLCIWIKSSKPEENKGTKKVISKLGMIVEGLIFMVFAKDDKGVGPKKNPDPDKMKSLPSVSKRIVFIRHGESDWNDVFNKGFGPSFLVRLLGAMWREIKLLVTSDSVFFDSPLNLEGFEQAKELGRFFEENQHAGNSPELDEIIETLRGSKDSSVIVTSNLRRAISTTTIALWNRLERSKEKVFILSSLQEISRNIDTKALADAHSIPDLSRMQEHCGNGTFVAEKIYDTAENHGNKTFTFAGIKRLKSFNQWVFSRSESTIITGGHSLWFRSYFQTYLPHACNHEAKKQKIVNSGAVAFTVYRAFNEQGDAVYRIDPSSVQTVYGGYSK